MMIILPSKEAKYCANKKICRHLKRLFFKATKKNDHECLEKLLCKINFADMLNDVNETPLNIISKKIKTKANIETVKILLRNAADPLWPDIDDIKPAKYILMTKDPSLIDYMLPSLYDVQAFLDPEKNTALHIAVELGDGPTVSKLLELHANPNIKNSSGYTPLHMAVLNSNHDFLKDMMNHGGDIDLPGREFLTPLHMAARTQRVDNLKAVLAFKPKTDVLNIYELTPLMDLLTTDDPSSYLPIYELIEYGVDPSVTDSRGYNCLHQLVDRGLDNAFVLMFVFAIRLFIQYGLDINAETMAKETALHIAIRKCEEYIVLCLLRYGCDMKFESNNGTALDLAMIRDRPGILECLITFVALNRSNNLLHYFAYNHPVIRISAARRVLTECQVQLDSFKD